MPNLNAAEKTCIYRFVQEGLNNGWRHAEGRGQAVCLTPRGELLELTVRDAGPGFPAANTPTEGLGLIGLRDRVEALGGSFEMRSLPAGGAELKMTLLPGQG